MRRGQALIGVLLVLMVVMTVVLSIASRSTTDVSVSTAQEEGARALTAAEAGIEAELGGIDSPNTTSNDYGSGNEVELDKPLAAGEAGTIFLSDAVNEYTGNKFILCWGQGSDVPAIEVMLYYKEINGNYGVVRGAYDFQTRGSFAPATPGNSGCPSGHEYKYNTEVKIPSDLNVPSSATRLFLRVRMFYYSNGSHYVGVKDANGTFPSQGQVISSVGQVGDVSRTVQAFQPYGDAWPILDSAVFSASSL